jgi:hypothetical protein
MAELGRVLSGARARLLIEGVPVMYCTNVSWSEEIQMDPVEVLDLLPVAEFVEVAYRVTFTSQHVRVVSNPIKNRDGIRIFPTLSQMINSKELVGSIEDSLTGKVLANVQRVKASRYTVNVGARGIVLTDVEFVAIRIEDESEIEGASEEEG